MGLFDIYECTLMLFSFVRCDWATAVTVHHEEDNYSNTPVAKYC